MKKTLVSLCLVFNLVLGFGLDKAEAANWYWLYSDSVETVYFDISSAYVADGGVYCWKKINDAEGKVICVQEYLRFRKDGTVWHAVGEAVWYNPDGTVKTRVNGYFRHLKQDIPDSVGWITDVNIIYMYKDKIWPKKTV